MSLPSRWMRIPLPMLVLSVLCRPTPLPCNFIHGLRSFLLEAYMRLYISHLPFDIPTNVLATREVERLCLDDAWSVDRLQATAG